MGAHDCQNIEWEGLVELTVSKKWCGVRALRYSCHHMFIRNLPGTVIGIILSLAFVASGVPGHPGALPWYPNI